jgi:glutathione S-transferase
LLATHSVDKTIKVWDIHEDRADEAAITFTDMPDYATSIRWSPDGKMIGGMCKNKSMVLFDPRVEASTIKTATHQGPRQQRLQWADDMTLITSGFDREAKRQWGCWDLRNMEQPLLMGPLNEGSGVPYIFYDRAYNILTLAGRGDNTMGIYHFDKSSPTMLNLIQTNNFLSTT